MSNRDFNRAKKSSVICRARDMCEEFLNICRFSHIPTSSCAQRSPTNSTPASICKFIYSVSERPATAVDSTSTEHVWKLSGLQVSFDPPVAHSDGSGATGCTFGPSGLLAVLSHIRFFYHHSDPQTGDEKLDILFGMVGWVGNPMPKSKANR